MSLTLARWLVTAVIAYLGAGALFAVAFALRGAARLDPSARAGTWGFRLLLLPGATALWPLLALRWARGAAAPPPERNAHRDAARAAGGGPA